MFHPLTIVDGLASETCTELKKLRRDPYDQAATYAAYARVIRHEKSETAEVRTEFFMEHVLGRAREHWGMNPWNVDRIGPVVLDHEDLTNALNLALQHGTAFGSASGKNITLGRDAQAKEIVPTQSESPSGWTVLSWKQALTADARADADFVIASLQEVLKLRF